MDTKQIAVTIFNQLGNQALAMMGAKYKSYDSADGSISFKIRGSKKFNYIKIRLNSLDLYDITFTKIWGGDIKNQKTIENIYADMLHGIIEKNTELYLSL